MDLTELIKAIRSMYPVSENFVNMLKEMVIPLSYPKNHILLKPPATCEHLYFMHRGSAMCYTVYKHKKNVEYFWKGGQFVFATHSFFRQEPSEQYIQLLCDSELHVLTHASVKQLTLSFPEAQQVFQSIIQHENQQARRMVFEIKHLDAHDRFEKLLGSFPHIDKIAPQEAIASYLGITPQSFSRIKRSR